MTTTFPIGSPAASRIEARWVRRPLLGWLVRIGSIAGPVVGSVLVAWFLTSVTPTPVSFWPALVRWMTIAATSSLVLVALERFTRRLLPIATLLDLTLAFPDQAPSRFKVALRTGTTHQLGRRIAEARSSSPADADVSAGQRVIELVAALSVHDRVTRGHSERVRAYTQMIAEEMGLSEHERDRLRWAGLLHDVGKLFVPTSILNKTERLTADEYEIVKTHPESGRQIIEELVPWLGDSARAIWEHHEKWDGSGYPRGLAGEEISVAARIVAVADVYDVMTSARSYKDPISPKEARVELARCAGTHFDPTVVRAFLNVSLGGVRRTAGPLSWAAQMTLFPSTVIGSTQAAGSAVVLTGALSASSFGIGTEIASDTFSALDPRQLAARVLDEPSVSTAGVRVVPMVALDDEVLVADILDQTGEPIVVTTTPPQSMRFRASTAVVADDLPADVSAVVTTTLPGATTTIVVTLPPTLVVDVPPTLVPGPAATGGESEADGGDKAKGDKAKGDKAKGDKAKADKAKDDKAKDDKAKADKAKDDKAKGKKAKDGDVTTDDV